MINIQVRKFKATVGFWVQTSYVLISLGVISVFGLNGIYAYPISDDYAHITKSFSVAGFLETLYSVYMGHGGLYSSVLFRYLHASTTRMEGYWLVPWVVLATHGLALYWLARLFLKPKEAFYMALGGVAVFLVKMPHVGEFLYWATGALVYATGTLMALLSVRLGVKYVFDPEQLTPALVSKTCLIIIFVVMIGTHWPFSFWGLFWALTLSLVVIRDNRKEKGFWIVLSVVSILCFLVVLLAPGNIARAGGAEYALSMTTRDIGISITGLFQNTYAFVFNVPTLSLAGFFFTAVALNCGQKSALREGKQYSVFIVLVTFMVIVAVFGTSAMAGHHPPILRTQNALFMLVIGVMIAFLGVEVSRQRFAVREQINAGFLRRSQLVFLCVLSMAILLDGHFRTAVVDLIKWGPRVLAEAEVRDQYLRRAAEEGVECVSVKATQYWLKTHTPYDGYTEDQWIGRIAPFYGLDKVILEGYEVCR